MTSPWGVGHLHLVPLACEFLKAYPDIGLRLLMTDRVLNPNETSIDVSIRIGPLSDSGLIADARRIGAGGGLRTVQAISQRAGGRSRQADLVGHDCITIDETGRAAKLGFSSRAGRRPRRRSGRGCPSARRRPRSRPRWQGAGIARVMSYKMEAARRSGALALVLEEFEKDPLPVHVLYAEQQADAGQAAGVPRLADARA